MNCMKVRKKWKNVILSDIPFKSNQQNYMRAQFNHTEAGRNEWIEKKRRWDAEYKIWPEQQQC